MQDTNLIAELIHVWPIVAGAGGFLYWLMRMFNDIKENDIRLHAENLIKISDMSNQVAIVQDSIRNNAKQIENAQADIDKLAEMMSREHKDQSEKFIRIDDKLSDLSACLTRDVSDIIVNQAHDSRRIQDILAQGRSKGDKING